MTTLYIHEQAAPGATTEIDLYEVPVGKKALISSLVVVNRGSSAAFARILLAQNGDVTENKQYLVPDLVVAGNDLYAQTFGITLNAGTVIRVYAENANFTFQVWGKESDA